MSNRPFAIGNAGYLSRQFTSLALSSIQAYREGVLRYVLPGFDAIEKDAEKLTREFHSPVVCHLTIKINKKKRG